MTPFLIGLACFTAGTVLGTYFGYESGKAWRANDVKDVMTKLCTAAVEQADRDRLRQIREQAVSLQEIIDCEYVQIPGRRNYDD